MYNGNQRAMPSLGPETNAGQESGVQLLKLVIFHIYED